MASLNLTRLGSVVEKYMIDTVLVKRKSGEAVDSLTYKVTVTYTDIYSGKAFLAPTNSPTPGPQMVGASEIARIEYEIAVPISAPAILEGDEATVTISADTLLLTRKLIILGPIPTTFATHRRLAAYLDSRVP